MITYITSLRDILIESVVGILVVFAVLTSLVIVFTTIGKIMRHLARLRMTNEGRNLEVEKIKHLNSYESTAITYALHLFLSELHDNESNVITIKRENKKYSPWSSKVYGLSEK